MNSNIWLMNIPLTESESNPTPVKVHLVKTRPHAPESIQVSYEPNKAPALAESKISSQSGLGQAADLMVFGAPLSIFR